MVRRSTCGRVGGSGSGCRSLGLTGARQGLAGRARARVVFEDMVRRDAAEVSAPPGAGATAARCATPAGASPVPVGIGAPGSRPQARRGDPQARAGCQKPVRRREPRSGERARGPQHEVKPAASTDEQSGGRAAHVTAKARPAARDPKRAAGPGGVLGAARVQGGVRNTRGPSAQPQSRRGGSYKPKAKSSAAQRESEGIVVPARSRRTTRLEGRVPGVVVSTERVSAREWPARPDLTTPAAECRATKCENCNVGCGPGPSGLRGAVFTRCTTRSRGVTSCGKRGSG